MKHVFILKHPSEPYERDVILGYFESKAAAVSYFEALPESQRRDHGGSIVVKVELGKSTYCIGIDDAGPIVWTAPYIPYSYEVSK